MSARRLAEGLAALHPSLCDPSRVATNIVYVDLSASGISAPKWCAHLATHGVTCRPYSATRVRLLTHVDVDDAMIEAALAAFRAGWPDRAVGTPSA